ncbi:MAG: LamG-like jellyroll fold domain-containing protein [Bacteroidota bacterium]
MKRFLITLLSSVTLLIVMTTGSAQAQVTNQALSLDGTDDYVSVPYAAGLNPTGAFTVEAWVNVTNSGNVALVSTHPLSGVVSGGWSVNLLTSDRIELDVIGVAAVVSAGGVWTRNAWQHVAVSFDPSASPTTRIYVNGSEVATGSNGTPSDLGNALLIGTRGDQNLNLGGQIDELRLWSTARTAAQISSMRGEQLAGNEAGLLVYHRFNVIRNLGVAEDGTDDVTDHSGNEHHGDTVNGPTLVASTAPFTHGTVAASDDLYENQVEVTWSAADAGSTKSVEITRDGQEIAVLASEVGTYFDTAGAVNQRAAYCVYEIDNGTTTLLGCDAGRRRLNPVTDFSASDRIFTDRVQLNWTDRSAHEDGFAIYRDDILLTNVGQNVQAYSDATAIVGAVYTYCVVPTDGGLDGSARVCDQGALGSVLPVASLTATDGTHPNDVLLAWTDQGTGATGFDIFRDATLIHTAAANETAYADGGATPGTVHTYCVARKETLGDAEQVCDPGSIGTMQAPSQVTATFDDFDDRVEVGWRDNTDVETGFLVSRSSGAALSFDGNDDFVLVPDADELDLSDTFTLEAWIKPNNANASLVIVGKDGVGSDPDGAYNMWISNSQLQLEINNTATRSSNAALTSGVWNHVALSYDAAASPQLRFYINGNPEGTADIPAPTPNGQDLLIGRRGAANDADFWGEIDELRIWNVARTEGQVQATMFTGPEANPTGLVAHYAFDEGQGTTAFDLFGRNEGTLTNFALSEATPGWQAATTPLTTHSTSLGLTFDGTEDFVRVPDASALDVTTTFTIEAWIWPENNTSAQYIVSKDGVGSDRTGAYNFYMNNGELRLEINNVAEVASRPGVPAQQWSHVAVAYDASATPQVRFYLNGAEYSTATLGSGPTINDRDLLIGRRGGASDSNFRGRMDDIRLWNTARTTEEIVGNRFAAPAPTTSGFVANWSLDGYAALGIANADNNGATAFDDVRDATGNHHGDAEGGPQMVRGLATVTTTTGVDGTTATDFDAAPNVYQQYCIAAFTDLGVVTGSNCAFGRRGGAAAPQNVTATDDQFEDRVIISWGNASTRNTFFNIYRDDTLIGVTPVSTLTFTDKEIGSDINYTYCVAAVSGEGVESPRACDTGRRKIAEATNVAASDTQFEDRVELTWADNSSIERGYYVFRRAILAGGVLATDSSRVDSTIANRTAAIDSVGVPGTRYRYSVIAFDNQGRSKSAFDNGLRILNAPAALVADDEVLETSIGLQWEDKSQAETGFIIYRENTEIARVGKNVSTYTDASPLTGQTVTYEVAAYEAYGTSERVSDTGQTALLPPGSVSASDEYPDRVVVAWVDQSAIETGYIVYRDGVEVTEVAAGETVFDDFNVPALNTVYQYCVATKGNGNNSEQVCDDGQAFAPVPDPDFIPMELRLTASNGKANDFFGTSTASTGSDIFIGATGPNDGAGLVYLFQNTDGGWTEVDRLVSGGSESDGRSGTALAADGNHLIATSVDAGTGDRGSLTLFRKEEGGAWNEINTVDTGSLTNLRDLGFSVDADGSWAVAGAPFSNNESGEIRFYRIRPEGLVDNQSGRGLSGNGDLFGYDVAIDGDIIAATTLDFNGEGDGRVYIYQRSGIEWNEQEFYKTPGSQAVGVDMDGEWLAVGAQQGDECGTDFGSVRLFRRNASNAATLFSHNVDLCASDGSASDGFGAWVEMDGEFLAVGAFNGAGSGKQAIYLFQRQPDDTWLEIQRYHSQDRANSQVFGRRISLSQGLMVAGDSGEDSDQGAAYIETFAPQSPTGMIASDGAFEGRNTLSWTDVSANEAGFRIFRDGTVLADVDVDITSYDDLTARPGDVHEYCVASFLVAQAGDKTVDVLSGKSCDMGWRVPDGAIAGQVLNSLGEGEDEMEVCLAPSTNSSLLFDGLSGHVISDNAFRLPDTFTIEFWARRSVAGTNDILFSHGQDATGEGLFIGFRDTDNFQFGFTGDELTTGAKYTDADWHHWAVVFDDNDNARRIYRDGVEVASDNSTSDYEATGRLMLGTTVAADGGGRTDFSWNTKGQIDEVRIWDDVRTPAEIMANKDAAINPTTPGLWAYLPLDERETEASAEVISGVHHLRHFRGASPAQPGAPLSSCAPTNSAGNYAFAGLRYGESTEFTLTPNDPANANRVYIPAVKVLTLSEDNPVQNEINFIDATRYDVEGQITFEGTTCPATEVQVDILLDGFGVGTPAVTDINGDYLSSVDPGQVTLTPVVTGSDRVFQPSSRTINLGAPISGLDFVDVTDRTISGAVFGGACKVPLGQATLRIRSDNGCFDQTIQTDASGNYSLDVPPQAYTVELVDITNVPNPSMRTAILEYFELEGPTAVDLAAADSTVNLVYRAPLVVTIDGLTPSVCDTPALPGNLPILAKGDEVDISISISEDYGNQLCPVDSGRVTLFNEIADESTLPFIIAFTEDDGGKVDTTFTVGNPNLQQGRVVDGVDRTYQKFLTATAEVGSQSQSTTAWAAVSGTKLRPGTQFLTTPDVEVPTMVLRDPPGDGSFSYWGQGQTKCNTWSAGASIEVFQEGEFTVSTGAEIDVGVTFGGEGSTEGEAKAIIGAGFESSITIGAGGGLTVCYGFSEGISTSDDPGFVGRPADIFLGNGMNFIFAPSDKLDIDANSCEVETSTSLSVGPNFKTNFLYTRDHVESNLIPGLRQRAQDATEDRLRDTFTDAANHWEKFLEYADDREQESIDAEAVFHPDHQNLSFSGGANYEYARTWSKDEVATVELELSHAAYLITGAEVEAGGNGLELSLNVGARLTAYFNFEHVTSSESEAGFAFFDDDDGDAFTVDVFKDPKYETPVFNIRAGASSCPYEPWLIDRPAGPVAYVAPRDLPTLSVDQPSLTDADPNEPAVFTLFLGNESATAEERTYRLFADQGANPGGALITANGESIGFDGQIFTVPYNQTQQITLAVERGPQNYSYQDLKVSAIPACELPVDGSDQAVSTTFSVAFTAPCSGIEIFRPTENWRITRANSSSPLEIILNEFSLQTADTGSGVTEIGMEYRRVGEQDWNLAFTATPQQVRDAGNEDSYTHNWAFSGPDGDYEIRAYTKCPAGTNYTLPVVGFVDTAAPVALEKPTPANGILTASDDISITFTEPVLCETVRSSGTFKNVQLTYLDGENAGNALPISTACDGDRLVIDIDDSITLASLQGQKLEARLLSGVLDGNNTPIVITDVHGNGLTEDIAWAFTARYSPFFFEPVNVAVSLPRGTGETFSTTLASLSTETETFQLVDVPDWLDVSVAANTNLTLPPGGTQPLTFTIPDTLIVGTRVDTVTVRSSQGDVLFFPTVTVTEPVPVCTPPDWVTQDFDPTLFSHQMMVYGQIRIDNAISTEVTGDMLGAFVDGELRGRAAVTFDGGSGNHAAVVSVRSHLPVGETVRFQVYDKSECLGYPNTDQVLAFGAQSQGSMANPVIMNAGNRPPLQAVALNEGWTWFSLNRRPADRSANSVLESLTVTSGDLIKSQTAFSLYTPAAGGWVGSLQLMDPASAYQVKLAQASALVIEGAPIDVAATPLTLVPGWNWVSYLPQAAQSVTDALASLAPQDGDMIKSQTDGFAQYSSGAWVGTLTQLEPGKGYLVNTQNGGTLTYPYVAPATAQAPVLAKATDEGLADEALASDALALAAEATTAPAEAVLGKAADEAAAEALDKELATAEAAELAPALEPSVDERWSFEKRAFPYSMTLTGALEQDDELVNEDGLVIVALAGEEVRGHTTLRAVRTLDGMAHRFFLTVYGSGAPGEAFRLEVYRNGEEPELIGLSDTDMLFSVNAHEGTVFQPKLLVLDNAAVEEVSEVPTTYALEQNYPNPFNPETVVRYALPESAPVRLTVVDVLGREVMTLVQQNQSAGFHTVTIDGRELASGVYFYVLKTPNFHQMHRMVLVK